ncbi:hypothetical protein [Saccharothrix deserti]|uniref:hypothetical protein n=1 Tax=Saccharothrix deserti TaxID=2593674 RepID=UPI00131C400B|nr:hypothetical protein [Saccharothrix deserti]
MLTTPPASATREWKTHPASSWAYTDLRAPQSSLTGTDAPVGAWRDAEGKYHVSKAYFTFDLTPFRNATVFTAQVHTSESAVTDCTKPRATELWHTPVAEHPTFANQPKELSRQRPLLVEEPCPASRVPWDVTDVVKQALADGKPKVTLALRMAQEKQWDLAYGRRYRNMWMTFQYNHAPGTPASLEVSRRPCGAEPVFMPNTETFLKADVRDPDGQHGLSGKFTVWDVATPDQRHEITSSTSGFYYAATFAPLELLVDGRTLEWNVRSWDGDAESAVSTSCRITLDYTRPHAGPTVTSPDYPENGGAPGTGGGNVPGRFTFSANGVEDVVGFWYDGKYVAADRPGGSATVSYTPGGEGPRRLDVHSVDRAGNPSPITSYLFYVRNTAPVVRWSPSIRVLGVPVEYTFSPAVPGVVEYTYKFNDGPETTVQADASGVAKAVLTTRREPNTLVVWARTADGTTTGTYRSTFWFDNGGEPTVTSAEYPEWESGGGVGVPGTFHFTPAMPGVVSYDVSFYGEPWTTIAAAPDGTGTFTFTPDRADWYELYVRSTTANGVVSDERYYVFSVAG